MKDLAIQVLEVFKNDGLWTATRQDDGSFRINKTKITTEQYNALMNVFKNLNDDGYTREEEMKRIQDARKETGSNIK